MTTNDSRGPRYDALFLNPAQVQGHACVVLANFSDREPCRRKTRRPPSNAEPTGAERIRRRRAGEHVVECAGHALDTAHQTLTHLANARGCQPRQPCLGHSTIRLTMDTYAHVLPDHLQSAAEAMDRALGL